MTEANAGLILNHGSFILRGLSLDTSIELDKAILSWFETLARSWFTSSRSTKAMMRGTLNESAALKFTRRIPTREAAFKVEILEGCINPYLACSPDGVAWVKADSSISGIFT